MKDLVFEMYDTVGVRGGVRLAKLRGGHAAQRRDGGIRDARWGREILGGVTPFMKVGEESFAAYPPR